MLKGSFITFCGSAETGVKNFEAPYKKKVSHTSFPYHTQLQAHHAG